MKILIWDKESPVLASLETVDLVIVFGEDTPLNLIQNILPEILVKGSDYTEEEVIGADIILRNGGKIL